MSSLTEAAAALNGATLDQYQASVDPVIFGLLDGWEPPVVVRERALRVAVAATGTSGADPRVTEARQWRVRSWLVTVVAPTWLRFHDDPKRARSLERLHEVTSANAVHASKLLLAMKRALSIASGSVESGDAGEQGGRIAAKQALVAVMADGAVGVAYDRFRPWKDPANQLASDAFGVALDSAEKTVQPRAYMASQRVVRTDGPWLEHYDAAKTAATQAAAKALRSTVHTLVPAAFQLVRDLIALEAP